MKRPKWLFRLSTFLAFSAGLAPAADSIDYNRDVRPVLSSRCFECHGPDEASREADLRLDRPEDAAADRGEYYQFMAFLNNADEPEIDLPDAELEARYCDNLARANELLAPLHTKWPLEPAAGEDPSEGSLLVQLRRRFDAWLASMRRETQRWTILRPTDAVSNSPLLTIQEDDSILASGDITKRDTYRITFRPRIKEDG